MTDPAAPAAAAAAAASPEAPNNDEAIPEPPADVKTIVDTTASWVSDNGLDFETEIFERNKANPRFGFLHALHPHHAYYERALSKAFSAKHDAETVANLMQERSVVIAARSGDGDKDAAAAPAPIKALSLTEKLDLSFSNHKRPPAELVQLMPECPLAVRVPEGVVPVDADIIKLTARFVALNGRQFLAGLTNRESRNPQFEFLRPSHPLFAHFQELTTAYDAVLRPSQDDLGFLQRAVAEDSGDVALAGVTGEKKQRALDAFGGFSYLRSVLLGRGEAERQRAEEEDSKKASVEEERLHMALIDWHDFQVAETVEFSPDELSFLPQPRTTLHEINLLIAAEEAAEEERVAAARIEQAEADMEMDSDEEDDVDMADATPVAASAAAETAGAATAAAAAAAAAATPAVSAAAATAAANYQKCPVCSQWIHKDEINEHMRIEMLDPKWKQDKDKYEAKIRDSNLAQGHAIAGSLARLATRKREREANIDERATSIGQVVDPSKPVPFHGHSASKRSVTTMAANQAFLSRMEELKTGLPRVPINPDTLVQEHAPPSKSHKIQDFTQRPSKRQKRADGAPGPEDGNAAASGE